MPRAYGRAAAAQACHVLDLVSEAFTMSRRLKRRWYKIEYYRPSIPGVHSMGDPEWRECARWVVLFGPEFAEAFGMRSELALKPAA